MTVLNGDSSHKLVLIKASSLWSAAAAACSLREGMSKQTAELQLNHGTFYGVPEMAQETPTSTNGVRLVHCILLDAGQWLDWMRVLSTQ